MKIRVVKPEAKEIIVTISEKQSGWTMHRINTPVFQKSDTKEIDLDEAIPNFVKSGYSELEAKVFVNTVYQFIQSELSK
jgi:hypothetical protein